MAITAETRQDIMELVVAANNAAPGTTLLSELVALSTAGSSLLDIANTLANSASFKATYPTFQTATEFGTEFLNNLVPEASAAAKAEGVAIIEGMLNAGQSRGAVILEAATYLAAQSESHVSFGTSAALFNNRVEVATYHTITSEAADSWAIPSSVTSSDATVTVGKGAVDTALTPAPTPAPTTYTLTASGGTVDEGNSGQSNLTYTLSLDKAAVADVVVNYSTANGTGEAGSDYDAAAGSVTFVAGQQNATVNVKINGDTTFESDETVNITFSGSSLAASVTASATISNDDTDPSTVAQAKTLTTGTDAFSTGSGNDTFDASTAGSLDTTDSVDGGAGSDTLTATVGAESIRPTISNVETINLTATGALTVDTRDISGVSTYANESSSDDLTLNNLGEIPALDLNTIVDDVTVNFADATLAGASDSMTINLNNVTLAGGERLTVSDAGGTNKLETIVLTSNSLASSLAGLTTSAVGTTALTITGDADLTVSAVDAAVATVDASAFTGALTATLGNTTGLTSVKGGTGVDNLTAGSTAADTFDLGAGNDVLNIATLNLTSADTIDGGAGTDTVAMSNASTVVDADFTNVSNVETLSYGNFDITLDLGANSNASGLATITDGTGDADITVAAGHTNALAIGLSTGDDTVDGSASAAALTVTVAGASLDGNDTLTGGTSTSDNLKVTGTMGAAVIQGFETITANDTTTAVNITTANAAAADGKSITIDGTGLTTGILTGDVSADTDGINTVKGGGAADDITASASDQGDTLHGNGGNDTFTFVSAQFTSIDTVDGGAGTDIITFSDADTVVDDDFTNVSNVETLTGHTGNSSITLGPLATAAGIVNVNPGTGTNTVTIPATHTGDLTVTATGTDTVSPAATYAGKLTVKFAANDQTTDTITGGAGTSDTIVITTDGTDMDADDFDTVTLFEAVDIAFNGDFGLTSASEMIATGKSMTYTASGQTTGAVTLDVTETTDTTSSQSITFGGTGAHIVTLGSGTDTYTYDYSGTGTHGIQTVVATAGNNTITTLDAADIITLGTGNDTVNSGAGNDTINVATNNFTSADTVDGGAGTDSVALSDNATVVDADFTNLSNVETISYGTNTMTLTLAGESDDAGIATVTDGSGNASITLAAGRTNALTVALSTGNDTVNASASGAALTVTAAENSITANDTITGGTGTSDTLTITGGGAGLTAAELANVTGIETFKAATDAAQTIVLSDNNVAATKSLAINAAAMTSTVLNLNASAETDGTLTVTTGGSGQHIIVLGNGNDTYTSTNTAGTNTVTATAGNNTITTAAGADIITLGTGNDTVNSGAANDTIVSSGANLTNNKTVDGGAGTDILSITGDNSTVIDSDFTNISNVETLTAATDTQMTYTLGANASDAGIATVTLTDTTAADTLTVGAGFTNNLAVNLRDNDTAVATVSAAAYTGTLTVNAAATDLDASANVITGGTGTADELKITGSASLTVVDLSSVSKVEKITAVGTAGSFSLTTVDALIDSGKTLTIDTTAGDNDAFTINASAESNGTVTINGDGVLSAYIITLGQGNDTYNNTANTGVSTVTGTSGNNTIKTGTGADIITLGTGTDTITASSGANIVKVSAAAQIVSNTAVVTDWTAATYEFDMTLAQLSTGRQMIELVDASDAATTDDQTVTITGATDLGTVGATVGVLVVNVTAGIADTDALETAFEYGGSLQLTAGGANAVGDSWLAVYDDTVSTYIALVTTNNAVAADGWFGSGTLTATNLIKLTGVADATDVVDDEIDFV